MVTRDGDQVGICFTIGHDLFTTTINSPLRNRNSKYVSDTMVQVWTAEKMIFSAVFGKTVAFFNSVVFQKNNGFFSAVHRFILNTKYFVIRVLSQYYQRHPGFDSRLLIIFLTIYRMITRDNSTVLSQLRY